MLDQAVEHFQASRPVIAERRPGVGAHEYEVYVKRQVVRIDAWRGSVVGFAQAMGLDVEAFVARVDGKAK